LLGYASARYRNIDRDAKRRFRKRKAVWADPKDDVAVPRPPPWPTCAGGTDAISLALSSWTFGEGRTSGDNALNSAICPCLHQGRSFRTDQTVSAAIGQQEFTGQWQPGRMVLPPAGTPEQRGRGVRSPSSRNERFGHGLLRFFFAAGAWDYDLLSSAA
jgi:hypothetical protein